jgi:cholesterol oxidase
LFLPKLGLRGIMRLDVFKGLMVLSGAGVGGGSLVYANTLIEPKKEAFSDGTWPHGVGVERWDEELQPHYGTAKRFLGVTTAPTAFPADRTLKETAEALGFGATFQPVNVGVFFGEPGVTVKDPYFDGDGPERSGCTLCGACMVGCRHNAKNTLVKNYLYLAERKGVRIVAEADVAAIRPVDGGYELTAKRPGWRFGRGRTYRASNVVLAAGVLGTLKLLLRCRDGHRTLPHLSATLGTGVRTNSESIIGVRAGETTQDFSRGVAIAAGVHPNPHTKSKPCAIRRVRMSWDSSVCLWSRGGRSAHGFGS